MVITRTKIIAVLERAFEVKAIRMPSGPEQEIKITLAGDFETIADEILRAPVITHAKCIRFTKKGDTPTGKTSIFQVHTNDELPTLLGEIKWFGSFRSYAFYPEPNTVYEPQCMGDILHFIEALMHLKRERRPDPDAGPQIQEKKD